VDLGALGVADRWADLAIATWSTTWNYGPQWQVPLLDAYGTAPDPTAPAAIGCSGTWGCNPGRLVRHSGPNCSSSRKTVHLRNKAS
jgi:hypothetical protein